MPDPPITTARTPRHALPYLFPGQTQKEGFVNEALARLDALVQPSVLGELATPPAAPASGDSYIVGTQPQGEWAGHSGAIATWSENQWLFAIARPGMRVFDAAYGALVVCDGVGIWHRASAPPRPAGGSVQDAEARTAIAAIADGLRALGFFP